MTTKLSFVRLFLLATCVLLSSSLNVRADIIDFIATGAAGEGLLEGNINPPTGEAGTGGIGATGITFNTDNNLLHVHLEWGSGNGYTDLSMDVFRLHLHGPTANGFDEGFGQVAPLMITLSNANSFDASATNGGINDNFLLDSNQRDALLSGRTYINVHLSDSDTGVIRGYLNPVPEPASSFFIGLLMILGGLRRHRTL